MIDWSFLQHGLITAGSLSVVVWLSKRSIKQIDDKLKVHDSKLDRLTENVAELRGSIYKPRRSANGRFRTS